MKPSGSMVDADTTRCSEAVAHGLAWSHVAPSRPISFPSGTMSLYTMALYLAPTTGRRERDHRGSLHHGRPDRERTEVKGESRFGAATVRADFSVERHS